MISSRAILAAAFAATLIACARESSTPPGATAPATRIDIAPAGSGAPIATSSASRPAPVATTDARAGKNEDACTAPCRGKPNAALVDALSRRAKQAHRCYDTALASDPMLKGRVMLHIVVGADGRSCSARADSEPGMNGVATCVEGYFKSVAGDQAFPPPDGGCADLTVPINFVPRAADAGSP